MTVNGIRLEPIGAFSARKLLPEGSIVIVEQVWRDKDYHITRRSYYRCRIEYKKTVAGIDVAVKAEPDSTWPEIPIWQGGWLWLEASSSGISYFKVIEEGV